MRRKVTAILVVSRDGDQASLSTLPSGLRASTFCTGRGNTDGLGDTVLVALPVPVAQTDDGSRFQEGMP
jgi:hypothetical protein